MRRAWLRRRRSQAQLAVLSSLAVLGLFARALACEPDVLIADEPTGQLDLETGRAVMDLIRDLVHQRGMTAVVATHDPVLMDRADRVVELHDGALVEGLNLRSQAM